MFSFLTLSDGVFQIVTFPRNLPFKGSASFLPSNLYLPCPDSNPDGGMQFYNFYFVVILHMILCFSKGKVNTCCFSWFFFYMVWLSDILLVSKTLKGCNLKNSFELKKKKSNSSADLSSWRQPLDKEWEEQDWQLFKAVWNKRLFSLIPC